MAPGATTTRTTRTKKLLECVTLKGVRQHQKAFQRIADKSNEPGVPGATRAAATPWARHRQLKYVGSSTSSCGASTALT